MSDSNKKDDIAETTEKLENVTLNTSSTVTSSDNKKEAEQPKKETAASDLNAAATKEETKENASGDNQASNDNQPQESAPTDDKTETKQAQPSSSSSASAAAATATTDTSSSSVQQQQVPVQAQQGGTKKSTVSDDPNNIDGDNTNLIINYLPPTMSEGTLATLFSPYGLLERCKIVVDLQTLRSRGYGFVKYDNEISAERALNALNGYELNGKKLKVAFARKQCKAITNANLYITNVPPHFTDNNLRKLFQDYGKIVECRVLMDQNGQSRGVGFVRMDTHHNAIQALQAMDQYVIDDKHPPLLVKLAQRRVPRRYWNSQNRNQNQGGGGKKNYNNQGGMGGNMNNNMGGNRDNKNKKRNSPNNRKYYSPKNYNNNNNRGGGGGGGMGMDNNNMNAPLGGNNMGGGNNRGSPSKRGYYRAKNNQGQQFNKGSNQQIRSNQGNYNNNNRGNRGGGGAGPNNNQAPYFPAPMHDAYPPYAAAQMAYQQPAYGANIANMNPAINNPSGVGGQQMSYKNQ